MNAKEMFNTALDILGQATKANSKAQYGDIAKANAISLIIEQAIGVRPDIIQDTTGSQPLYILYFADNTKAATAIVESFSRWRGKLASKEASNISYNFGDALVPAIVRSFFWPIAGGVLAVGGIGYLIGKAN